MRKSLLLLISLIFLTGCSLLNENQEKRNEKSYEHVSFTSSITTEECVACGSSSEHRLSWYIGQKMSRLLM